MKKMLTMFAIAAIAVACSTTSEEAEECFVEEVVIDSTYVDSNTLEGNFDDDSFGEEASAE